MMAPLLLELSQLEIEALEVVVNAPELEQDRSLEALTIVEGEADVAAVLALKDTLPVNHRKHCHHDHCCQCECSPCC